MYERMLNKQIMPAIEEMIPFCGKMQREFLSFINGWHFILQQSKKQSFLMAVILAGKSFAKSKRN